MDLFDEHQTIIIVGVVMSFLISILLTGIIIPKVLLIAFRKKLFDVPDERKIHKSLVPRLGGIAFVPALLISISMVVGLAYMFNFESVLALDYSSSIPTICFCFSGLMLLYMTGIADDLIGLKYRGKFFIQIICGILLISGGVCINNLHGFCGVYQWPDVCGYALTLLVVIFFTNAINLIDGVDGLASGLSAIAMAFYGVVFTMIGDALNACIAFAMLGTLIQFFYYNVFGKADKFKKIFMGDTGSLCVGFVLTYLSVQICNLDSIVGWNMNPIVVAFAPMLVPCFDVIIVVFGRIRAGKSPFLPDKTHIHHKMLQLGMHTSRVMVSLLIISAMLTFANIILSPYLNPAILMLCDILIWISFNLGLSAQIRRRAANPQKITT